MYPVKNGPDCIKYKASNQKPSGLLQTPVPTQRLETLAIDLFGPLPERSKDAKECAITLIEEVLLRYGIPRRLISDNGTQFVSAVMQQICYLLNIHQSLIPVYHPQANPVERKNRDLKPRLAILVQDKHDCRSEKLPFIRFALNTAKYETIGQTAAFLNFGRELRTASEVVNDIRVVIQNDNFVQETTPYLKKFAKFSTQIREVVEEQQDSRKFYADKKRKTAPTYQPGEHAFVASHPLSNAAQGRRKSLIVSLYRNGVTAVAELSRYRIVAGLVTSSSPVPLKTRLVGERCTLNLSRAQTSSRRCGVGVRRGGASSGVVHVTRPYHGSKLHGPSSKALV
ncbi:retrovirus-related Pol polyprotein from transposon 412 [Trichonephila clavipes]|nr:retrovirus-related Pol polyprotein from transposon 412 [Trichonephila clavipes]